MLRCLKYSMQLQISRYQVARSSPILHHTPPIPLPESAVTRRRLRCDLFHHLYHFFHSLWPSSTLTQPAEQQHHASLTRAPLRSATALTWPRGRGRLKEALQDVSSFHVSATCCTLPRAGCWIRDLPCSCCKCGGMECMHVVVQCK